MPAFNSGVLSRALLTIALIVAILIAVALIRWVARLVLGTHQAGDRPRFWIAQGTHLLALVAIVVGVITMWSTEGRQLATVGGWIAAGIAVALQRVITSFAGYLIILRGNIFTVGERIMLGGVRGDVVGLGFMQTTVMEMGQSPGEQGDNPSMWIHGRQYTGRLVRVTNDKIFDTPLYNYTREFQFLWEEMMVPIAYSDDYHTVEKLLLEIARKHTADAMRGAEAGLKQFRDKYYLPEQPSVEPQVYMQLTDNWIQLTLRFIVDAHHGRATKNTISRDLLAALEARNIGLASGTYAIVNVPTLKVKMVE